MCSLPSKGAEDFETLVHPVIVRCLAWNQEAACKTVRSNAVTGINTRIPSALTRLKSMDIGDQVAIAAIVDFKGITAIGRQRGLGMREKQEGDVVPLGFHFFDTGRKEV